MPGLSNDGTRFHKRGIDLFSIEVESGELKEEGAAISIPTHCFLLPTYSVFPINPYQITRYNTPPHIASKQLNPHTCLSLQDLYLGIMNVMNSVFPSRCEDKSSYTIWHPQVQGFSPACASPQFVVVGLKNIPPPPGPGQFGYGRTAVPADVRAVRTLIGAEVRCSCSRYQKTPASLAMIKPSSLHQVLSTDHTCPL